MSSITTIDPESAAGRVAQFIKSHPDAVVDRTLLKTMLGVAPAALDKLVQPAIDAGLITAAHDGDLGRIWRAGRLLKDWQPAGAPIAPKTTSPGATASVRGGTRKHLPELQAGLFKIAKDLPLPTSIWREKGKTKYDHVLDPLTEDGMSATGIPMDYYAAIAKAVQSYLAYRPELANTSKLVVRKIDGQTCGVWRVKKEQTS
jgi:hypothetical protein